MTEEKEQTALAPRQKAELVTGRRVVGGIIPRNIDEMWRLSVVFVNSGMMPKGVDTVEKVCVAVQMGLEIGLQPMQAVQNIAVINGRPSVWGDAMLGLVQASGLLEDFAEEPLLDDKGAVVGYRCLAKRVDRASPIIREFTTARAEKAGLLTKAGPWATYPERMLQMRARSWALRDGFADVLKGLVAREEAQDIQPIELNGTVAKALPDPLAAGRHRRPPKSEPRTPGEEASAGGNAGGPEPATASAEENASSSPLPPGPPCPDCAGSMSLHYRHGVQRWECNNFPHTGCRGTVLLTENDAAEAAAPAEATPTIQPPGVGSPSKNVPAQPNDSQRSSPAASKRKPVRYAEGQAEANLGDLARQQIRATLDGKAGTAKQIAMRRAYEQVVRGDVALEDATAEQVSSVLDMYGELAKETKV